MHMKSNWNQAQTNQTHTHRPIVSTRHMFCRCLWVGWTRFFLLRGCFHVNPKLPPSHRKKRINPLSTLSWVWSFSLISNRTSSALRCPLWFSLARSSTCSLVHTRTYSLNLQLENQTLNPSPGLITGCFQCRDILGTTESVADTFISPNPSPSPLPSPLMLCLFSLSWQRAPD